MGLSFIPQVTCVWSPVEWYWRENRRTQRKTCSRATVSTTNLIWTDTDTNPVFRA